MGRAAQGVRLINLKGNAEIAAIARVPRTEDEEEIELDENGIVIENPIIDDTSTEETTEEENSDME